MCVTLVVQCCPLDVQLTKQGYTAHDPELWHVVTGQTDRRDEVGGHASGRESTCPTGRPVEWTFVRAFVLVHVFRALEHRERRLKVG